MPDEKEDVWVTRIKALRDLLLTLGVILTSVLGFLNHDKITTVQNAQAANSEKLDEAKKEASEAKTEAAETKKAIVETKKAVMQITP